MSQAKTHILVVNQHGDNRGDEAALRALLASFSELLGEVRFTVVHQSRDREMKLSFEEDVSAWPMILPFHHALGLGLYGLARRLGLKPRFLLSKATRAMIDAYEETAVVVSAPGGPYFGDIYRDHELVHWFFVWLAKVHKKPAFLYATSAGPFKTPVLNTLRRRFFGLFDTLCVREEVSAGYLRAFLGPEPVIHVTADSALQCRFPAWDRSEYFQGEREPLRERFLVAVTAIRYAFPEESDPAPKQRKYEEALMAALEHLHDSKPCHFIFFPQLYGDSHSDVGLQTEIGERLPEGASWEVVDPALDAAMHQRLIAMSDFSIACRYHPQIFAAAGTTPGICVYYEHKAASFMEVLGLAHLAFPIREPSPEAFRGGVDRALEDYEEVQKALEVGVEKQRAKARRTTELAVELLRQHSGVGTGASP